jgi:hypothetical protein
MIETAGPFLIAVGGGLAVIGAAYQKYFSATVKAWFKARADARAAARKDQVDDRQLLVQLVRDGISAQTEVKAMLGNLNGSIVQLATTMERYAAAAERQAENLGALYGAHLEQLPARERTASKGERK